MRFPDREIADAVFRTRGIVSEDRTAYGHEHPDSVRIAAEWFDAQHKLKRGHTGRPWPIKHMIEAWGGRYVSYVDAQAAALLLDISGKYPLFGISSKFVFPDVRRLAEIGEAFKHPNYCDWAQTLGFRTFSSTKGEMPVYATIESGRSYEEEQAFHDECAAWAVAAQRFRCHGVWSLAVAAPAPAQPQHAPKPDSQ